jgi:hypothetical protein
MMKKLCLVFVLGAVALCAADGPNETFGMKNGRFWINLPSNDASRVAFLIGLLDGWELRGYTQDIVSGSVLIAMSSDGYFTTSDMANMVTSVYADTENLTLPVGWVALGCLAVQRGDTTRDAVFMALRKHLSSLRNRKDELSNPEIDAVNVIIQFHKK